jgi:hypothetical protein
VERWSSLSLAVAALLLFPLVLRGDVTPGEAAAFFDFSRGVEDLAGKGRSLRLHGAAARPGQPLEFTSALQYAELDREATGAVGRKLDGIQAM